MCFQKTLSVLQSADACPRRSEPALNAGGYSLMSCGVSQALDSEYSLLVEAVGVP